MVRAHSFKTVLLTFHNTFTVHHTYAIVLDLPKQMLRKEKKILAEKETGYKIIVEHFGEQKKILTRVRGWENGRKAFFFR